MIRPIALLPDRQGPAHQRLRHSVFCLLVKPEPILIAQRRQRSVLYVVSVAVLNNYIQMGRKPFPSIPAYLSVTTLGQAVGEPLPCYRQGFVARFFRQQGSRAVEYKVVTLKPFFLKTDQRKCL